MESHIILKNVTVVDPGGSFNGKKLDVRVKNGYISEIGKKLDQKKALILEEKGSFISPGWMDGQAHFRDPGLELKEGLERGLMAGAAGGFTDVAILPSTNPPIDNKSSVSYLVSRGLENNTPCMPLPLGCVSVGRKGEQLAELLDMSSAGAIGFSDDGPISRVGLLQRALEYLAPNGDVVVAQANESDLNLGATIHEGATSTALGLTGSPSASETIRLKRDIEILSYTGGRLHIPIISSAEGVKLIKAAKKRGLFITASTTPHHLTFCDEDLGNFDGTLKVHPPLRSKSDRKALRHALSTGILDTIVSDHRPENIESHDVEFTLSPYGMSGIESVFAAINTACPELELSRLVDSISNGTRRIYNIPEIHIEVGAPAKITWFDPNSSFTHPEISGGVNDPWKNRELKGSVLATINGKKMLIAD
ncbi:MAG TPA: dihydroorotase [Flavobacteriales bacterium]|jgi:dihydroorotase|nr:dihydroorotase [Flavobacteriales bacterium]HHZ96357.1 dihydroorotase [Flavobacteriales bacterium]HIB76196.1 dihydroorotase [Flavobacteriales bacterium]HIN42146.1 dihydroorotase [Flavobacteriales bacterium]HIO15740.1 dihydroorotase [Flavobacteriales bacterium]